MNEKIKELAEQARIKDHWSVDECRYLTNYLDENKFAELIVRECADLFDKDEMELTLTERTIHHKIKAHFGVEE